MLSHGFKHTRVISHVVLQYYNLNNTCIATHTSFLDKIPHERFPRSHLSRYPGSSSYAQVDLSEQDAT